MRWRDRSGAGPGTPARRRVVATVVGISVGFVLCGVPAHRVAAEPPTPHPGGFWKCLSNSPVKGEFGGQDPIGLASGHHIPTDCAIHWADGHGKTYCFASLPSLSFFDADPELLRKAEAFWRKEHGGTP